MIRTTCKRKEPKYHNRKCTWNGEQFDSQKERDRYAELTIMQRAGKIYDLARQVRFELIPAQRDLAGRIIERPCTYVADFTYMDKAADALVVEDTKGYKTPEYIIKRKLMLQVYKLRINEI